MGIKIENLCPEWAALLEASNAGRIAKDSYRVVGKTSSFIVSAANESEAMKKGARVKGVNRIRSVTKI